MPEMRMLFRYIRDYQSNFAWNEMNRIANTNIKFSNEVLNNVCGLSQSNDFTVIRYPIVSKGGLNGRQFVMETSHNFIDFVAVDGTIFNQHYYKHYCSSHEEKFLS